MNSIDFLILLLTFLILVSAFFSCSETGMIGLNRYRVRHLARKGSIAATRVIKLLERPDRLLGMILLGNTFANIFASAIATVIAQHYFGEAGVILASVLLTFVILIIGETAPKTLAALYPERVAYPTSLVLVLLLKLFYPLVWVVNILANGLLRLFGICTKQGVTDQLSAEELRTVVHEASSKISANYQQMLLRILDLKDVFVEDVMVPRKDIYGIDLEQKHHDIITCLSNCTHSHIPLYWGNINQIQGVLNLRKALLHLQGRVFSPTLFTKQDIIALADDAYFIPARVSGVRQLRNFQREKKQFGLIVDEYGDIQGIVTLQDILEEIVGEFAGELDGLAQLVRAQEDGSYLVDGQIEIRELIRSTGWHLPTDGPRTLSGLIIEYLEMIPKEGTGARIDGYPMEIIKVHHNTLSLIRVWPLLYQKKLVLIE